MQRDELLKADGCCQSAGACISRQKRGMEREREREREREMKGYGIDQTGQTVLQDPSIERYPKSLGKTLLMDSGS